MCSDTTAFIWEKPSKHKSNFTQQFMGYINCYTEMGCRQWWCTPFKNKQKTPKTNQEKQKEKKIKRKWWEKLRKTIWMWNHCEAKNPCQTIITQGPSIVLNMHRPFRKALKYRKQNEETLKYKELNPSYAWRF